MEERVGVLPAPGTPPESAGRAAADLDGTALLSRSNRDTVTSAQMRRKKWSEEEEETLISKYGELLQSGALHRLKTREKKFEPIAAHVNSLHHSRDKVTFPWEWTWRDLSVKIQNMRHQYLGVKQKIRRPLDANGERDQEEFDWNEGIVHWSNFLRYKDVFGDLELESNDLLVRGTGSALNNSRFDGKGSRARSRLSSKSKVRLFNGSASRLASEGLGGSLVPATGGFIDRGEKAVVGDAGAPAVSLEYEWEEDDVTRDEDDEFGSKKKKRRGHQGKASTDSGGGGCALSEGKVLAFLGAYIADQRERETQREARDKEKDREREEKDRERADAEKERERIRFERETVREEQERKLRREREDQAKAREVFERERWEAEKLRERAWEEKREREKQEWRERLAAMQLEHQSTMMQMQSQMLQSQQNMVSLLLGLFLHGGQVGDSSGSRNSSLAPLTSQILRNLQQLSAGAGQGSERKTGIESAAHFIVDGDVCVAATE